MNGQKLYFHALKKKICTFKVFKTSKDFEL